MELQLRQHKDVFRGTQQGIDLRAVVKDYKRSSRIGPISLCLPKGCFCALVGPNGAGKSTLLGMIGNLIERSEGSILIDGVDVAQLTHGQRAHTVSILCQENHIVSRLTVRQLVNFGRFPHSHGRMTSHDKEVVDTYLHFFALTDLEDRFIDELSGGQRQRAYVAMVLAQETPYILLDEPLNNLDIAHSVAMMRYLREIVDTMSRTIIIVLHDINFAAHYADTIVAMKGGVPVYTGDVQHFMNKERLTDIYQTAIDVLQSEKGPVALY